MGPPGAGKGTQAKGLAQDFGIVHISTGNILRQNLMQGTLLGKQAQGYMNKGTLVPDDLVTSMLAKRIDEPDIKGGFILDGYPRNLKQAEVLDKMLKERSSDIDMVIHLDTSIKVIVERITGRLVCKSCGANFHAKNMPPKKNRICDNCGGLLYQRPDDNENTIKTRLEVYNKEVQPIIHYYEGKQKLFHLSADEEAGIVFEKLVRFIKEHDDSLKV